MRYAEILANLAPTPAGCWEWQRARLPTGYGVVSFEGRNRGVHRVVYEREHGPIPDGLDIDHLCRNRACANPDHLEAVTHAENKRREVAARTHCSRGHEFTPENTYTLKSGPGTGNRRCVTCHLANVHAYRRRKEAAK